MQKDNLDLLAEQLVSEINWNDDNIVQKPLGTFDPKTGVRRTNFVGNSALDQGLEDLDNKKYNQPINLVAANGENYTIIPNDQFREIGDKHRIHTSNGVSPQRGMNRNNRFALQYGGLDKDKNDIIANNVKNSHIISYSQFNDNPSFQGLLGQALLKFYQDKNIPEREQPLKINYLQQSSVRTPRVLLGCRKPIWRPSAPPRDCWSIKRTPLSLHSLRALSVSSTAKAM